MFNFLRSKTVLTLVALVFLGVLVGSAQNRELASKKPFFVQDIVRSMLVPVNFSMHAVADVGRRAVLVFRPRSSIIRENDRLRKEVRDLKRENARLRELADESVSLRKELGFRQASTLEMTPAEIVSRGVSNWFDTATINAGSRSGVERGAAVVNHLGLIGQIVDTDPFTSEVVALSDQSSAVGAMVRRSRCSGVIQGQGADDLVLAYLPKDADVKVNDEVISSGMGQVVPKGLPIGRVVGVVRNSLAGTTSALVRPSVRFDQAEQVFVVKPGQAGAE